MGMGRKGKENYVIVHISMVHNKNNEQRLEPERAVLLPLTSVNQNSRGLVSVRPTYFPLKFIIQISLPWVFFRTAKFHGRLLETGSNFYEFVSFSKVNSLASGLYRQASIFWQGLIISDVSCVAETFLKVYRSMAICLLISSRPTFIFYNQIHYPAIRTNERLLETSRITEVLRYTYLMLASWGD